MSKKSTADTLQPMSARFRPDPKLQLATVPGRMIIKIKSQALSSSVGTLQGGGAQLSARVRAAIPESVSGPLDYLKDNAGLKSARPLFETGHAPKLRGLDVARVAALSSVARSSHEDLAGFTVVDIDPKKLTTRLMKHLSKSSAIQFVEPMPTRWMERNPARRSRATTTRASDPMQASQWALDAIGWHSAKLPTAAQAEAIKVAVLDTGIDEMHEDLQGKLASYDYNGSSRTDVIGHGTHVAGIIAAATGNGIGISGVAACRLAVWKIFDDEPATDGKFYVNGELYLRALGLLTDSGCRIVNLSIGGTASSRTEALLFRRLRDHEILPVAAMGNAFLDGNPVEYPAAYEGVLGVGAISSEFRRASFSNTGRHIWIAAPGHTILSTVPMKKSKYREEVKYASWNGTSMATPYVAGCAALYLAKNSGKTADQMQEALKKSAKRLPDMGSKTFTDEYGYGLVDLAKLL